MSEGPGPAGSVGGSVAKVVEKLEGGERLEKRLIRG